MSHYRAYERDAERDPDDFPNPKRLENPHSSPAAMARWGFIAPKRIVEEDSRGRHRPDGWQLPKHDIGDCARARDAMRPEPGELELCPACRTLWPPSDMGDHPCDRRPTVSKEVAGGGSTTFAVAAAHLYGADWWSD